ncbi:sigma-70 family RNA polymerase sigma factor [Microlunatus parietis]|uniref:RNA polymerase sigma-B factor n=1 Tax=Microlunatus parietis TaxID=682979 RepID=A0A7Y9I2M2_9ACTN|nr:sigma-70 family RNA polymerase sigma factor [Microlunatus parietis]NYE68794.1 RNA polymerase sigma-B factor [Microlunatus parietis]
MTTRPALSPRPTDASASIHESAADETTELLQAAKSADRAEQQRLRQQVVLLHLDLADALARRYHGRGLDPADLDQVARLALVQAVDRADPERGDFVPFAVSTIRGCLKRYFRDHGWVVRPPRRIQELQHELTDTWNTLSQEQGAAPTIQQLAVRLGEPVEQVAEAAAAGACFAPVSLDAPAARHESPSDLGSRIGAVDGGYDRIEWLRTLREACAGLPPDDLRIIELRFVEQRTQQQIADELGVSQMQISRSLRRILRVIREQIDPDHRPEPLAA